MTPKTLWQILIKVMGIWLIFEGLAFIPQVLTSLVFLYNQSSNQNVFIILSLSVVTVAFYFFILWSFLFRTDNIIRLLRLEKGFTEETISFNIHRSNVLKIIVILIGGLIIIDSLPQLFRQSLSFFRYTGFSIQNPASSLFAFYLVKLFIGVFLVSCSRLIVNLIERQRLK